MQVQVEDWLNQAKREDTVLVFFAGHGFLDDPGRGYLGTQDCEMAKMESTALRSDDLRDMLRRCKAKQKLLVLDCCHSGETEESLYGGRPPRNWGRHSRQPRGSLPWLVVRNKRTPSNGKKSATGYFPINWPEESRGWRMPTKTGWSTAMSCTSTRWVDSDELYQYTLEWVLLTAKREFGRATASLFPEFLGVFYSY